VPRRNALPVLVAAWLILPALADARQTIDTTTSAIGGKVTDPSGAVLADVAITLSSGDVIGNNGTRTTTTDAEGLYRFPGLPPGEYSLVFSRDGFSTLSRQDIHIGVAFSATVNAELQVGSVSQNVLVERRSPVVDARSTAIGARFDARLLADLPGSRSAFAILTATPAVQVARFEVGGGDGDSGLPYSAYGTRGANRPMVEGINIAGMFPSGFTLDYGSFREVFVGAAVHGAEWPVPGVQMQLISKSGGNRYHATIYADYESHAWQSFNIAESQITSVAQLPGAPSPREANRVWSYHDLNGDLGGYVKRDTLWWYGSVRAQDVSARQVNFPVKPLATHLSNYTAKTTYRMTPANTLVVFGQGGRNHQPNLPGGFTLGPNAAINLTEDSTANLMASGWIWKTEWDSTINPRLLFEIRAGEFGTDRPERPNGSAPRFEDAITSVVRGGNRDWQENRRNAQVLGSLSYFKDGWFGDHQVKAGGEALRATITDIWRQGYPDDVVHILRNGDPAEVYLFEAPSRSESGLRSYGAYVSDLWRLNARLSLNPGVRFDRYRVFFPEQAHPPGPFNAALQRFAGVENVIDWNLLAPRVGAIVSATADGKTLLKFNYGQYWFGPGSTLGPNTNPNSADWWQHYSWSDLNADGRWEGGEERRFIESRGGVELESIDPALRLPRLTEVAISLEDELMANVGLRTSVVWRGERGHYLRQNPNRSFAAFSVPVLIQDPGRDGKVGTPDDESPIQGYELPAEYLSAPPGNVVRNVPDSDSHYWTWDVAATRRFSRRWSMVAAFAHTWNADQSNAYLGQAVRQNTYALTPNDLINAGGDGEYDFRTWSAKLYGTCEGPWGLRITPYLRHQSGQPFGRTLIARLNYGSVRILAEPMDARRMDNVTLVDVRVEKGFRLPGGRVAGFIDAFNLLNANPAESVVWTSGASFMRPLAIVAPRIARVGIKLDW
jgi:carboxypeptidase family protein/TonB-dependent receptor-like protein